MDPSDEEDFSVILEADEKLKDLRKPRSVWVRKHFKIGHVMTEFFMSFRHVINHPDEMFLFNYMRMSFQNNRDLKDLIQTHIN